MKRWINARTNSSKEEYIEIVNRACDYLGIDYPIEIRKKGDGYKLIFDKWDELTLKPIEIRYSLHSRISDELGWDFDDDKNTYDGTYEQFLKEKSDIVNAEYDKLYDDTGIRFVFTKREDDMFLPSESDL